MTTSLAGQQTRNLQHELRTAVNHILGYANILIDASEENRLAAPPHLFEQIYAEGLDILNAIQAVDGNLEASSERLFSLSAQVRPRVERIVDKLGIVPLSSADAEALDDIQVIAAACRRLLALTGATS